MEALDREFMRELWTARVLAPTQFEAGFYTGMFQSHAQQNAISLEEQVVIMREAREATIERLEMIEIPVEVDVELLDIPVEVAEPHAAFVYEDAGDELRAVRTNVRGVR